MSGADEADRPEKNHLTQGGVSRLLQQTQCVKRYGRATLTIRRWGGYGELAGGELGRLLTGYREGAVQPEDVTTAFVAARVVTHSPSFSWETADTSRVLRVVVSCSSEPSFDHSDVRHVADILLAYRDEQDARLKKAAAQVRASMKPVVDVTDQISQAIKMFMGTQQSQLAAIVESIARTTSLVQPAGVGRWISEVASMKVPLGVSEQASRLVESSVLKAATLNLQQFRLPNMSSVLADVQGVSGLASLSSAQWSLMSKNILSVTEALNSVRFAADLVQAAGDATSAKAISVAASEADVLLQKPDSGSVREAFESVQETIEDFIEEYREDREHAANVNLILWAIAVLVAIYVGLWPYLFRP